MRKYLKWNFFGNFFGFGSGGNSGSILIFFFSSFCLTFLALIPSFLSALCFESS